MKKLTLAVLLASSAATYGASNVIPLDSLMLYSIIGENAKAQLAKQFPHYATWLSDSDVLLLLNFIATADKPVILKFSADWCSPCKRLAPIMHEAALECRNEVIIIEVNIDDAPAVRQMFAVDAVPTLIYFKNGLQVDRTNNVSKSTLLDKIKKLIDLKSGNPVQ